ncbi:MAG: S53 family peptidase, partial [Acetobacteraceae bacterium]
AIIALAGGWAPADMVAFSRAAGLPSPAIADISIGTARNDPGKRRGDPNGDPDIEVTLDIEIAAAAFSLATGNPAVIRVYWADGADFASIATAVTAAAADGCDVCSITSGSDEANWQAMTESTGIDYVRGLTNAAEAAVASGMVICAAAGDNDSSDGGPDPANVDLPSSLPFVIACGGTRKTPDSETVWNTNPGNPDGHGTGGGFSRLFRPMPSWQAGAPNGPGRMVPDVSANADPETGYDLIIHGSPVTVGGTSAVAPLYAGLFAAFGRKRGFINPKLWLNQTCFNDITQGDNGYFSAWPGPDPCSGIGTPIASRLARLFSAALAPPAK